MMKHKARCPKCGEPLARHESDICDDCHDELLDLGILPRWGGASAPCPDDERPLALDFAPSAQTSVTGETS